MTRRQAILALAVPMSPAASLLMDVRSRRVIETNWPDLNIRLAFGSLMKPFIALSYGGEFPVLECRGCWKPGGHGRISLTEAIAYSCNSYFLALARGCTLERIAGTCATYGLPQPDSAEPEVRIGLKPGWQVTPTELLGAFCELALRARDAGPSAVLAGMRMCARQGTARAIHQEAYAKTGTGPCNHHPKGRGDGYAVALFPTDSPRLAKLVALHNRPGAEAARYASFGTT